MSRNIKYPLAFLCLAAAGLLAAAPVLRAAPPRRPSVVLVILDAVRADRTSPYGYDKAATPALGALAARSFVFENAYANSNWTGASFASILTGKRPFSHGMAGSLDKLSEDTPTIQSVLFQNGYETSVFFSGLAGEPGYGNARGAGYIVAADDRIPMSRQVAAALDWQKGLPADKDFFILLHGNDAHAPYHCSSVTAAAGAEFPELTGDFLRYYHGAPGWDLSQLDPGKWKQALPYRGNAAFLASISKAYDLCVSREDKDIASLVHGLEAAGGRPLLLIVTADHGELLGEHGIIGHGRHYFEPLVRVPLLVRFPGESGARRVRGLAEHVDLFPTICAAAGISCPGGLDGKDLSSEEKKNGGPVKWAAAGDTKETRRTVIQSAAFSQDGKKISLRNGRWELFNLLKDPGETKDLARERPGEFLKLASAYLAFSGIRSLTGTARCESCYRREPPPLTPPPGALPCARTRLEASTLARAGDFAGAAARLEGSDCTPASVLNDKETLELLRRETPSSRLAARSGYKFATLPGRWKVEKEAFSAVYSEAAGLACENADGRPVTDPGCVPVATAMLNCLEYHRFGDKEREDERNSGIREALKKAGYVP